MKTPALPDLLRLGSSSFSCTDWVGPFYPPGTAPGDFLVHYAGRYDTVEIDSTYYAVPSARMDPVTAGFAYVRLLGDREAIEKLTTTWDKEVIDRTDRLRRWARLLARLTGRRVPSFVYVNTHYAGHAPATLETLRRLVFEALEGDDS